jgi:hypothetical protein
MTELPKPTRTGFILWLRECFDQMGRHGAELVEHNAKLAYGKYTTFPADADEDILKAEALGWITRGKCTPTPSQRAFLGLMYAKRIPDSHASCWYWEPAQRGNPKRDEAAAWLKAQESAVLGVHRCSKAGCLVRVDTAGAVCHRTDALHV